MAYINDMNRDRFNIDYILQENFYDKDSKFINSNFLASLNESQKVSLADMMGGGAAKNSQKKLAKLNAKGTFLDLAQTKGNFKKSKAYITTKAGISMLAPMMQKIKGASSVEAITAFQCCEAALNNLEKNTVYFERAYQTQDSANILAYQTIAAALIDFVSIIIANACKFDDSNMVTYKDNIPKNTFTKNVLFRNLCKFNDICRNNKLKLNEDFEQKLEEYQMTHNESVSDLFTSVSTKALENGTKILNNVKASKPLMIGLGIMGIASSIISLVYLSRSLICYFFFKKVQISESLKYISGMVEANSVSINNNDPKNKRIAGRQVSMAAKLKRLGETLDSDNKQAQHNSISLMKKEDQETSMNIESKINPDNRQEVTAKSSINNPGDDLFI